MRQAFPVCNDGCANKPKQIFAKNNKDYYLYRPV